MNGLIEATVQQPVGLQGDIYQISGLRRFETRDSGMPYVYMTEDAKRLFLATGNGETGVHILRIEEEADIRWLAHRFGLQELLNALKEPRDPAESAGDRTA